MYACYLLIRNPKVAAQSSKARFTTNVYSCLVPLIKCMYNISLKWPTMTWLAQLCALVVFKEIVGPNQSFLIVVFKQRRQHLFFWSVYLHIDPNLFTLVLHDHRWAVTNMQEAQSSTPCVIPIKRFRRTPSCVRRSIRFGLRLNNLLCQYLNSFCKGESTLGNNIFSIVLE